MSAITAIQGIVDRVAKGRQNGQANFATGDDFWTRVDAAADETFENRVKGSDITDLDAALAAGQVWDSTKLRKLISLLNSYLAVDLGTSGPDYLDNYLASLGGWRVPYEAGEAIVEAVGTGGRLPACRVFPKGTWAANIDGNATAGLHRFGSSLRATGAWTWTEDEGALPITTIAPVFVAAHIVGGTPPSACVVHGINQSDAEKAVTLTETFAADAQFVVGEQNIAAEAAAGQKVVTVAVTGQFTDEEWVLLISADLATAELCQVDSIVTNTSLTMKSNLLNTFANTGHVWPLFKDAHINGVTGGTNDDTMELYARPDRAIAL